MLKEFILNEEEKELLKSIINVLKMFNKNKEITIIEKRSWKFGKKEYLIFDYDYERDEYDYCNMPAFNTGELFKNMETGKKYSLKELDLYD